MEQNEYHTYDTFEGVRWRGRVELIHDDPLKMGRVRVRIHQFHTDDINLLPSNKLPFAQVPEHLHGTLEVNSAVNGYFEDRFGDQPVIVSRYIEVAVNDREDPRPQDVVDSAPVPAISIQQAIENNPSVKNGNLGPANPVTASTKTIVKGEPTLPRLARGVVQGTNVFLSNKNRIHVCDIRADMKRVAALARLKFGKLMQIIRAAIQKVLNAIGGSPDGAASDLIETAKYILRKLQYLNEILQEIRDWTDALVKFAQEVRAVIDWILTLPAKLLELLRGCLANLLASLKAGFNELFISATSTGSGSYSELIQETNKVINEAKKVVGNVTAIATAPVRIAQALATPASAADVAKVESTVISLLADTEKSGSNTATGLQTSVKNKSNITLF